MTTIIWDPRAQALVSDCRTTRNGGYDDLANKVHLVPENSPFELDGKKVLAMGGSGRVRFIDHYMRKFMVEGMEWADAFHDNTQDVLFPDVPMRFSLIAVTADGVHKFTGDGMTRYRPKRWWTRTARSEIAGLGSGFPTAEALMVPFQISAVDAIRFVAVQKKCTGTNINIITVSETGAAERSYLPAVSPREAVSSIQNAVTSASVDSIARRYTNVVQTGTEQAVTTALQERQAAADKAAAKAAAAADKATVKAEVKE